MCAPADKTSTKRNEKNKEKLYIHIYINENDGDPVYGCVQISFTLNMKWMLCTFRVMCCFVSIRSSQSLSLAMTTMTTPTTMILMMMMTIIILFNLLLSFVHLCDICCMNPFLSLSICISSLKRFCYADCILATFLQCYHTIRMDWIYLYAHSILLRIRLWPNWCE